MRELKFRGKTISFTEKEPDGSNYVHEGKWIYGFYHKDHNGYSWIIEDSKSGRIYPGYEVDPETVGQYTGLKDKNEKEIYEGDIILCKRKGHLIPYKVYVDDTTQSWSIESTDEDRDLEGLYDYHFECQIIGSIHTAPEGDKE